MAFRGLVKNAFCCVCTTRTSEWQDQSFEQKEPCGLSSLRSLFYLGRLRRSCDLARLRKGPRRMPRDAAERWLIPLISEEHRIACQSGWNARRLDMEVNNGIISFLMLLRYFGSLQWDSCIFNYDIHRSIQILSEPTKTHQVKYNLKKSTYKKNNICLNFGTEVTGIQFSEFIHL